MKKQFLCALMALMLAIAPAMAEGGLVAALGTPEPVPAEFEADGLQIVLPLGMIILEGDALAAHETAVQLDYPEAARTILAAVDAQRGAALILAEADSEQDCLDAARSTAEALTGDPDAAEEVEFGENRAAAFTCELDEQTYSLYYLSDGSRLIIIAALGLEQDEIDEMLSELRFSSPRIAEEEDLP